MPPDRISVKITQKTVSEIAEDLSNGAKNHVRTGILVGNRSPNGVKIVAVYVPEQTSGGTSSRVSKEEYGRAMSQLRSSGLTIVGFVQYNGGPAVESNRVESYSNRQARMAFCKELDIYPVGLVVDSAENGRVYHG
ncbi:MAG: hypothetical protein QGH47_04620 [Candidatus Woesearchaeota archaeon]|nr:hypothetical protein [Candidatus Woesearchaeota archaeon]